MKDFGHQAAQMIDVEAYIDRLRRKLSAAEELSRPEGSKHAAVLVPLVTRGRELSVIYTRRSDRLASHRGQVAFPGGRFDRRDVNLLATALRETHEEVGIAPDRVEALGSFEGRATRSTNIFVTPFVGIVHPPFELRPDPKEVAEIFEVPLSALTAPTYRGSIKWTNNGVRGDYPAILYEGQTIWGLTYELTLRFLELTRKA